jgi:4'-phosphopantetheinyl transferase EntD
MRSSEAELLAASSFAAHLPTGVGSGLRRLGEPGVGLWPGEAELLSPQAGARRRDDFLLGRTAARDALAAIGQPPASIGSASDRSPIWPGAVVGAISHSAGAGAAVAASRAHYRGLGLDLEALTTAVSDRAAERISSPAEQDWLAGGGDDTELPIAVRRLMLFSAKESVFKALYPLARVWLEFRDAELTWDAATGAFDARVRKAVAADLPTGCGLRVRVLLFQDFLVTFAALPHEAVG